MLWRHPPFPGAELGPARPTAPQQPPSGRAPNPNPAVPSAQGICSLLAARGIQTPRSAPASSAPGGTDTNPTLLWCPGVGIHHIQHDPTSANISFGLWSPDCLNLVSLPLPTFPLFVQSKSNPEEPISRINNVEMGSFYIKPNFQVTIV